MVHETQKLEEEQERTVTKMNKDAGVALLCNTLATF